MEQTTVGYNKPLYILPFDHRAVFATNMFSLNSIKDLSNNQRELIKKFKILIYKGIKNACEKDMKKDFAGILVDEEFGSDVLIDAKKEGFVTILTIERSGASEFEFQYENFKEHIEKFKPTFTKVLIKYNPQDDEDLKLRQKKTLKIISDYSHTNGYKFLLEVLVLPTKQQLIESNENREEYDANMRPNLTVTVVEDLHSYAVEPDVWKLEGFDSSEHYTQIINSIKQEGREKVGLVILGRGAGEERVDEWLKIGSKINGVIGFAVGRTVFWNPLEKYAGGQIREDEVVKRISENFLKFYKIFTS